jgi:hypothetical protein
MRLARAWTDARLAQEKRLRLRGKLQAVGKKVGQKVKDFWADHTELSQYAERFADRFLRCMKGTSTRRAVGASDSSGNESDA